MASTQVAHVMKRHVHTPCRLESRHQLQTVAAQESIASNCSGVGGVKFMHLKIRTGMPSCRPM